MNIIDIPESWGIKRTPSTPIDPDAVWHGLPYESYYDYTTLFVDAINIGDNRVLLIGPPLYDIEAEISFYSGDRRLPHSFHRMDRMLLTLVTDFSGDSITLKNPKGDVTIPVVDTSNEFAGMHVVTTTQKDEPLCWTREWMEYYYKAHGVRGFVFYNNNCSEYSAEEMIAYLSDISDDIIVKVEESNIPYGPPSPRWDNNFCQHINFEHFKYKYAWCARSAINQDIDEILVFGEGITLDSITDYLTVNKQIGVVMESRFIDPYSFNTQKSANELAREDVHFIDYLHWWVDPEAPKHNWSGGKWIAIPEFSMEVQWTTHNLIGAPRTPCRDGQAYYGHYKAFKSSLKNISTIERARTKDVSKAPLDELIHDPLLEKNLRRAFN